MEPSSSFETRGLQKKQLLPVIHVGFPKSASTTIQHGVLAHLQGIRYVSRRGNRGNKKHWELYEVISRALTTGEEVEKAQAAWNDLVHTCPTPKLRVFSDERISLPGRHRAQTRLLDRCDLVRRIFGQARVLLVIRNPLEYLRSMYQHMEAIRSNKWNFTPPRFDLWLERNVTGSRDKRDSIVQALYFGEIAARYVELFGKENVTVLFLEDLKADPAEFLRALHDFIGIPQARRIQTVPPSRNVTAEKEHIEEIDRRFPGFASPRIPDDYTARALPVIRHQAGLLHNALGIDAMSRWPQLAAANGSTPPSAIPPTVRAKGLAGRIAMECKNLWSRRR